MIYLQENLLYWTQENLCIGNWTSLMYKKMEW